MAKVDKIKNQRDVESFKARKNFEEREARKESKYRKPRHFELDVCDDVDVEDDDSNFEYNQGELQ